MTADIVPRKFKELITLSEITKVLKFYSCSKAGNSHFWGVSVARTYKNSMIVVKIICCLLHGNANVERGFSVNSECLLKNMGEQSVIGRRQVYDSILNEGGVGNSNIWL